MKRVEVGTAQNECYVPALSATPAQILDDPLLCASSIELHLFLPTSVFILSKALLPNQWLELMCVLSIEQRNALFYICQLQFSIFLNFDVHIHIVQARLTKVP